MIKKAISTIKKEAEDNVLWKAEWLIQAQWLMKT